MFASQVIVIALFLILFNQMADLSSNEWPITEAGYRVLDLIGQGAFAKVSFVFYLFTF